MAKFNFEDLKVEVENPMVSAGDGSQPEPEFYTYCDNCESIIVEGDECYAVNGEVYCEKCIQEGRMVASNEQDN